ncbi:MAG: cytidylate kinase family protein [Lentisphaeria bacterium]
MAIITIARELGTNGTEVAEILAERLSAQLIDKEMLEKLFKEQGGDLGIFNRYDEKKPGIFSVFSADQDIYLQMLKLAMYTQMQKGPAVLLGRAGNILMEDMPNCLRIRLIAEKSFRVAALKDKLNCSEEKAEKMIEQSDRERKGFCKYHFDTKWTDATRYDLILNSKKCSAKQIADIIERALHDLVTPEKDAAGTQMLKDKLLGQKILNEILIIRQIGIQFLEVQVLDSVVTLEGITSSDGIKKEISCFVEKMPGVKQVQNEIQVVHDIPLRRM